MLVILGTLGTNFKMHLLLLHGFALFNQLYSIVLRAALVIVKLKQFNIYLRTTCFGTIVPSLCVKVRLLFKQWTKIGQGYNVRTQIYVTSHNTAANSFKTQQMECITTTYLLEVAQNPHRKKWHKTHLRFLRAVNTSEIIAPGMTMHLYTVERPVHIKQELPCRCIKAARESKNYLLDCNMNWFPFYLNLLRYTLLRALG